MLIASTGGHLAQLLNLRECWSGYQRHWVTFDKSDALTALRDETVTWAYHPTTRNARNAIRNFVLSIRTLVHTKPDVIVSTGAGVALPFFLVARFLRIRTIYLEAFERIEAPSLTGLLCYPLTDRFCVQWAEQQRIYPEGVHVGPAW
ncbi:oligosaccharide biosynthesis protein Alg14 [Tamaricihabitans halophyticus]|uniref:Oligosaccharide biosynthesis protein Alg14 n=1 Tax=Tamaricihabitans halophyticus TaxID=1262583 RepID=A0A4R2R9X9_9PSEU|nr:PssD/Cps14F family polysaccharide biosynthesis glycosyltransferase [Tamaricihabitans halophyticus]TCP56491.1 oligosaccharide biosynthesis protein Alg14 [Tamaricihabitans halophyticus]